MFSHRDASCPCYACSEQRINPSLETLNQATECSMQASQDPAVQELAATETASNSRRGPESTNVTNVTIRGPVNVQVGMPVQAVH